MNKAAGGDFLTEAVLRQRFEEALARMPCRGRSIGLTADKHPEDDAYRMTMADIFVTPFHSIPHDEAPLALFTKDYLWGQRPNASHANVHRRALGAHMVVKAMDFDKTARPVLDPAIIRDSFCDAAGFREIFSALYQVNRIKAQALVPVA